MGRALRERAQTTFYGEVDAGSDSDVSAEGNGAKKGAAKKGAARQRRCGRRPAPAPACSPRRPPADSISTSPSHHPRRGDDNGLSDRSGASDASEEEDSDEDFQKENKR